MNHGIYLGTFCSSDVSQSSLIFLKRKILTPKSLSPDDPDPSSSKPASAQCLTAVGESDSDDEVEAGGCLETYNDPQADDDDDGVLCDPTGYFYGHPSDANCKIAQEGIGEGVESISETYEFLGVGAQRQYPGFPIAQTPFNWSSGRWYRSDTFSSQLIAIGDCYIQVSMLEGGANYVSSNLEDWEYIWGRAEAIREKCVVRLGVGGSAKAGRGNHHSKS